MKTDREQQHKTDCGTRANSSGRAAASMRRHGFLKARQQLCDRDAGPNPTRSIGDKTANTIEAAFKLEPGALDKLCILPCFPLNNLPPCHKGCEAHFLIDNGGR